MVHGELRSLRPWSLVKAATRTCVRGWGAFLLCVEGSSLGATQEGGQERQRDCGLFLLWSGPRAESPDPWLWG